MGQPWITQGCGTSHGGTVVTSTPFTDIDGVGVARKGDMVVCPQCKGAYPIVEGDETLLIDGAPVAYQGCKTLCGATLFARQATVTTEKGPAAPAGASGGAVSALLAKGVMAAVQRLDTGDGYFTGRFRLLDAEGAPLAHKAVRVTVAGEPVEGETDADGYTEWIEREAAQTLSFELLEEADRDG
ncbi:PAAR domain-containing protein [Luteimonas sp. SJ-92]|uniref:PAAR domain-containing protein n=1 Tax=Luteimonas salinisoli TaxID=2752307 RepID=A0A853JC57_9GAMM|nr:PAAR domain-containing protein [Luteimonas salinisoli]NZA26836.1 PAAR domain-containing protein [Luteimonas salinisoli]